MNRPETIDPEMTVDEIMRRWPATIRVMIRNRMLCAAGSEQLRQLNLKAFEANPTAQFGLYQAGLVLSL